MVFIFTPPNALNKMINFITKGLGELKAKHDMAYVVIACTIALKRSSGPVCDKILCFQLLNFEFTQSNTNSNASFIDLLSIMGRPKYFDPGYGGPTPKKLLTVVA
ncbi:hypothetical protein LguiB_027956 [Lonicera macranthoides]